MPRPRIERFVGHLVSTLLLVVGVIHLLPLGGVLGSGQLATLYGRPFSEPNLEILMRHRAVLLGLVGLLLVFAAFKPAYQSLACLGGLASVVSFLWLAFAVGGHNPQVARVFAVDVAALACLGVALAARAWLRSRG